MNARGWGRWCASLFLLPGLLSVPAVWAQGVDEKGQLRQPTTFFELVYSFDHTFINILPPQEYRLYRTKSPDEIREEMPELYERISQNVTRWTDFWIEWVATSLETVPEKRLARAHDLTARVDVLMSGHFEERGWPYRALKVVFLPQRIFHDERSPASWTMGAFIPFYPDVFFATVDPASPMELVLLHETIHYNKRGDAFSTHFTEGVTEIAARHLTVKFELLSRGKIRQTRAYPWERKRIEALVELIVERTGRNREDAIDRLLQFYLTSDSSGMNDLFGAEVWKRVMALSEKKSKWNKRQILKALNE